MGPLGARSRPRTRKPFLTRGGRLMNDFVVCFCDLWQLALHLYRQRGEPWHRPQGCRRTQCAHPAWATRGLHAAGSASFVPSCPRAARTNRSCSLPHRTNAATLEVAGVRWRPRDTRSPRAPRGCAHTADTCVTAKKRDGHVSKLWDT